MIPGERHRLEAEAARIAQRFAEASDGSLDVDRFQAWCTENPSARDRLFRCGAHLLGMDLHWALPPSGVNELQAWLFLQVWRAAAATHPELTPGLEAWTRTVMKRGDS